jgi:uncharacterized SAM-binding protein YcdF (DUF218 family)
MFWLKKVLTLAMMPLSVCLGALWIGVILLWAKRWTRLAKVLLSAGALILTLLSFEGVVNEILKPLELCYPSIVDPAGLGSVKWVVVLGGGHTSKPDLPATAQIGSSSLARLVEGIRLHRQLPGSKLLLSGGAVFDPVPEAETMAAVARILGLDANDMVLERDSRDTGQQAEFVHAIVANAPCVVVTSAVHMPRAMRLFNNEGITAFPAPVEISDFERREINPFQFFFRAVTLCKAEAAWHEYLGLLWAKIKG